MALTAATTAAIITATTAAATTTVAVSKGTSAKKRAASQTQQAERIRAGEIKRTEDLAKRAEGLSTLATTKAASIAAGKKQRRRTTLATGPRGLLTEPELAKPGLLGS